VLSNRYITDRFLPDKAIDLVDESAARLRMQVDSKPEELDELDRRIMQLKIEREALKKETDQASKDRLERLDKELSDIEEKSSALTARWQSEKQKLGLAADLKLKLEAARNDLAIAQRRVSTSVPASLPMPKSRLSNASCKRPKPMAKPTRRAWSRRP
jgi:ATP-dependent Clp protease ATP-binding subunit ClpB